MQLKVFGNSELVESLTHLTINIGGESLVSVTVIVIMEVAVSPYVAPLLSTAITLKLYVVCFC